MEVTVGVEEHIKQITADDIVLFMRSPEGWDIELAD
jgi:hypothetical protein